MSDLTQEISCPVCGEKKLASSFLVSKISGQRICAKCWRAEKKSAGGAAAAKPAPAAAESKAAPAEAEKPATVTPTPQPAPAAAVAPVAAHGAPFAGQVPCPVCGNSVNAASLVTSKKGTGKICPKCYTKEARAAKGKPAEGGAAPAAKPGAAKPAVAKPKPAAVAAAAAPAATAVAEAPVAVAEPAELGSLRRFRAATVALRPVASPTGVQAQVDRRGFLGWLGLGWAAFTAATAQSAIALGRFMFPNVLFEPPSSFKIGYPDEFEIGKVDERFKTKYGIWVVREEDRLYVLSTVCTHLGCTPNWLENEGKYKCPCHGSGFRKSGINFEGPAPRPLERFRVTRADDGQIEVDTTNKYQYEKGQWNDPDSFLSKSELV